MTLRFPTVLKEWGHQKPAGPGTGSSDASRGRGFAGRRHPGGRFCPDGPANGELIQVGGNGWASDLGFRRPDTVSRGVPNRLGFETPDGNAVQRLLAGSSSCARGSLSR